MLKRWRHHDLNLNVLEESERAAIENWIRWSNFYSIPVELAPKVLAVILLSGFEIISRPTVTTRVDQAES